MSEQGVTTGGRWSSVVTDWSGAPLRSGGRALAAANRVLLEAALEALAWS